METKESDNRFNKMLLLGAIVVFAILGYAFSVTFLPIPEGNKQNAATCLGLLLGVLGLIVGYYFGSSQGMAKKTAANDSTTTVADVSATFTNTPAEK